MAKPDTNFPEKQTWGTWEELLLACAVHRYGTDNWDSVAMEVQKRSSTLHVLTSHSCQHKYSDLKRRFTQNDAVSEEETETKSTKSIPWLDELRKLRVDELRREVERYDLSIVSLQLKVKRLKEEREESLRENEKETEKSDLERPVNEEKDDKVGEPEKESGKSVAGEESDRSNRSVNESNSTDPKDEGAGTGKEEAEKEPEPVEPEMKEPNRDSEEGNGSCDSVAKESAEKSERVDPGESPELWESVGESNREREGEEGNMDNSDMQSSASLSGKKEKPENEEDQSPAIKRRVSVESQPLLLHFLEIIRSHKFGSLFERRFHSQETPDDIDVIRQHIDLETIGTRLEEGWYSGCNKKFFRDLLLVFNNAIVFFGKKSSESMAAIDLRQLVSKEIALKIPKPSLLQKVQSAIPPGPPTLKLDPEPSHSLALQPKISVPLIACRKRSSITAKSSGTSSGADKKRERTATLLDEKSVLDWKQQEKSFDRAEEQCVTKKRTRERSTSGARKTTKNSRSRATTNTNKNTDVNSNNGVASKVTTNNDNSESKAEKKKKNKLNASAKKQSAAKFLNRMKRSSSSNNGSLLETLKGSAVSPDNVKGESAEQKKNGNSEGDSSKDQISRKRSGGKRGTERGSPTKRSTGRPPKRAAAPAPLISVVPAKRGREAGETEAGSSRHSKKRSRR